MLTFNTFKDFIDEVSDYLLYIILWNWGEPFLNPDIFEMIAYAKSKNIVAYSSTNGNVKFNNGQADKLVDSGLDSLVFGVDGATQETYSKYRKGGNLELVLENIRTIVSAKKRKGSKTPRLNMRFVVMQHNEKELPLARQLAEELQVDFFTLKTADLHPACGENVDSLYAPENHKYRRYKYEAGSYIRKKKPFVCMRPWKRITMDASGEIIACEYDYENLHSFGNVNVEKSAVSVWKGKSASEFRKKFNLGHNNFYLCRECTQKNMVAYDCSIEKVSLERPLEELS